MFSFSFASLSGSLKSYQSQKGFFGWQQEHGTPPGPLSWCFWSTSLSTQVGGRPVPWLVAVGLSGWWEAPQALWARENFNMFTRWWFQISFFFTPTCGRFQIWLYNIFFRWVETTNKFSRFHQKKEVEKVPTPLNHPLPLKFSLLNQLCFCCWMEVCVCYLPIICLLFGVSIFQPPGLFLVVKWLKFHTRLQDSGWLRYIHLAIFQHNPDVRTDGILHVTMNMLFHPSTKRVLHCSLVVKVGGSLLIYRSFFKMPLKYNDLHP